MKIKSVNSLHPKNSIIKLNAIPETKSVLVGVKNKLNVQLNIVSSKNDEDKKRTPMHLVVVLDRSGSMSGKRILFAKRAVIKIIKHLHVDDTLSLIAYDTNVDVIFEDCDLSEENKDKLKNIVNDLHTKNSTNIEGGLKKAHEFLLKKKKSTYPKRIFLFSDGSANVGLTSAKQFLKFSSTIAEDNINISSFGIGNNFNTEVMKSISTGGSGNYYYLDTAKNIPKYVSKAIHGLIDTIGYNATIKFRGKNNAIVNSIANATNSSELVNGHNFGDIYYDNTKRILTEIEISPTEESKNVEILTFELEFTPVNKDTQRVYKGILTINYTKDDKLLKIKNDEVVVSLVFQESNEIDRKILDLMDKNKKDEAIQIKSDMIVKMKSLVDKDQSGNLIKMISKAELTLQNLKNKNVNKSKFKKSLDYQCYQNELNDDQGYYSGSDSDSYDDDEESLPEDDGDSCSDDDSY